MTQRALGSNMELPTIVNLVWTNKTVPIPSIGQRVASRVDVWPKGGTGRLMAGAVGTVVRFQGMLYSDHPHETGTHYFLCPLVKFERGQPVLLTPNEVGNANS